MGTWLMPKGVGCALGRLTGRARICCWGWTWGSPSDSVVSMRKTCGLAAPLLLRVEVVHGTRLLHPIQCLHIGGVRGPRGV